ncbi:hypothetical protein GCM10027214_19970 [Stenotrophomonas tumulicola]
MAANGEAPRGGSREKPDFWVGAGREGFVGDGKSRILRASFRAIHGAQRPHEPLPPGPESSLARPATYEKKEER